MPIVRGLRLRRLTQENFGGLAFKLTAFSGQLDAFESHARRFLHHTALDAILWINIARERLTFPTLQ